MALPEATSSTSHPRVVGLVPPDAGLLAFDGLRMSREASWDDRDTPQRGRVSLGSIRECSTDLPEGSFDLPEGSFDLREGSSDLLEGSSDLLEGSSDLLEGSSDLPEGSSDLLEGSFDLPEGSSDLPEGSSDLPEGSSDLPEGSSDLPEGSSDLPEGSSDLLEGSFDLLERSSGIAEAPSFPSMPRDTASASRLLPKVTKIVPPMACEEGAEPRPVIEPCRQSSREASEQPLAAYGSAPNTSRAMATATRRSSVSFSSTVTSSTSRSPSAFGLRTIVPTWLSRKRTVRFAS